MCVFFGCLFVCLFFKWMVQVFWNNEILQKHLHGPGSFPKRTSKPYHVESSSGVKAVVEKWIAEIWRICELPEGQPLLQLHKSKVFCLFVFLFFIGKILHTSQMKAQGSPHVWQLCLEETRTAEDFFSAAGTMRQVRLEGRLNGAT